MEHDSDDVTLVSLNPQTYFDCFSRCAAMSIDGKHVDIEANIPATVDY